MTTHIMLDLETLSTRHDAYILAIGAVMFDKSGIYNRFYQAVKTASFDMLSTTAESLGDFTDADGFHISKDTLDWWQQQSTDAKAVFVDAEAQELTKALGTFATWVEDEVEDIGEVRMWGNGAGFDNVILSNAYHRYDWTQPWKFYNDRCYRTVKAMFPDVKLQRVGTHHDALADAESQALHLLSMGAFLGK